ncbi:MAG: hypothetical protein NTX64_10640 [Elusimicrobia bacterium]|nr:hypothetical protein [Elusimicrobiota bacterium]
MALATETAETYADALDTSLVTMIMVGVLCLGMALGLEIYPHFVGGGLNTQRLSVNTEDKSYEAVDVAAPAEPQAPAPRGPLTFAELMQILSPRRADPAAVRFTAAFMANQPLKKIYLEFAAGPATRPAQEFVSTLQHAPEFGDLVRVHSKAPGFRAVAAMVTRNPEVNRLLHGLKRPGTEAADVLPLPDSAPSDKNADTLGAEAGGRYDPVSRLKAPGQPVEAPAPDR